MTIRTSGLRSARRAPALALFMACGMWPGGAGSQTIQLGDPIFDLPRRGYEVGRWRIGNATLAPTIIGEGHYDSNVFATSVDARQDAVFNIIPRLELKLKGKRLDLTADAMADSRLHATSTTENNLTYGTGVVAAYDLGPGSAADVKLRYDRSVQSRADPEAIPVFVRPAKIDGLVANIGYRYQPSRIGFAVRAGVEKINFLDPAQDDRDQTSYTGSIRASARVAPTASLFVQGFGNRRDAMLAFDRNGIDRDLTTFGVLTGVQFDLGGRWQGQFGVGGFRANPSDPTLSSFSGFSMSGQLVWSPTPRTAVTLQGSSGDVATIRAGANGRIDTNISLRVDQEARHNLLMRAGIAYQDTRYSGNLLRRLKTLSGELEVEYLATRVISIFARATISDRKADSRFDRFDRSTVGAGVRLRI